MSILTHFIELFFPRLCICCQNRLIQGEEHICLSCLSNLPQTDHLSDTDNKLEDFFAGRFPFGRIASFAYFSKGGSIQKLVHELKYKNNPDLGIYIGRLCGKQILKHNAFSDIDYIVPIPLHKNRIKKRGYNQSFMIAKGISQIIKKPVNTEHLIREIDNPSQTKNSRFERWENTKGIFRVTNNIAFENSHVLLIDDIITTGSTLEVCAKEILKCDNAKVSIYTVGSAI